jgi:toxin HigB-1
LIRSFKCRETEALYKGYRCRRFQTIESVARRKLRMLNDATSLRELAGVPDNRVEALKGDRTGQYSIRVNDQFRVCFLWTGQDAKNVEIIDYH